MQQEQEQPNLIDIAIGSSAAEPAPATESEPAVETMPSMAELLKKAELDAQEHHDAWMRARAEAENIRKRAQSDIANAQKFAVEGFSNELLAVKDSLEAALKIENTTVEALRDGVELTLRQLNSAFQKYNLVEIDPTGEKFDPYKHQAISMVPSDAPPNTVVAVMQKGYALNERILRPAMVMVAKPAEG